MPLKTYLRPRSLEEALDMRASSKAPGAYIAGGTEILADEDERLECVVDLSCLGLSGVSRRDSVWRIGATTPLADLARDDGLARFADGLLTKTAGLWRTSLLRERATLGGVLAGADATADLAAALLALDAVVLSTDLDGEHQAPLAQFYLGQRLTLLGSGILTAVEIPAGSRRGAHERASRTRVDVTLLGAAATHAEAFGWRLALCGAGDRPSLVPTPELEASSRPDRAALDGIASRIQASISPPDDQRASAAYRRTLAGVLTRRVLSRLAEAQT